MAGLVRVARGGVLNLRRAVEEAMLIVERERDAPVSVCRSKHQASIA